MKIELSKKEIYAIVSALDHTQYLYRDKRKELVMTGSPDREQWDAIYANEIKVLGEIKQELLRVSDEERWHTTKKVTP